MRSTGMESRESMNGLLLNPVRAGRHLAIWLIWHATGTSLIGGAARRRR
jgi:hypothetical protein